MHRYALAFAFVTAANGCASDPVQLASEAAPSSDAAQVQISLGDSFRLRTGEVAAVTGGTLLVTFRGIDGDSRCPVDANCVWAGDAKAIIGVGVDGGSWEWIELHTGTQPRSRIVPGFTITLAEVAPAARLDSPIVASEYNVLLRIERE